MSFDPGAASTIAKRLRFQARGCADLGSPLYEGLLARAARDVEGGGPLWELLSDHADDPGPSALALRLMGSVHRLVLAGEAPDLAAHYNDPDRDPAGVWTAFAALVASKRERLSELIDRGVQTNEVGRCAALLPGFLAIAGATGLPLRLLEAGSSAGLNLRFDLYRYEIGGFVWGPAGSGVRLTPRLEGEVPASIPVEIAERAGCDAAPVDPHSEDGRLTLLSYLWPDQPQRIARLRAALELAPSIEAKVEQCSAPDWIAERLSRPAAGLATVVFHSIFIQYPSDAERAAFIAAIEEAGERATNEAPFAWLRMEPAPEMTEVRLTTWPGGEECLVARAGYHGDPIELL